MSKIVFISFFFITILVISSCTTSKEVANKSQSLENEEITSLFPVSASTKRFLYDFNNELKKSKVEINSFEPSLKLIDSYSLRKINEEYCISGFIKVNESFLKTNLESKGVTFGSTSGKIITINVPLVYLEDFLKEDTIQYFEISSKVQIK